MSAEQRISLDNLKEGLQQLFFRLPTIGGASDELGTGIALPLGQGESQEVNSFDGKAAASVQFASLSVMHPGADGAVECLPLNEGFVYIFVNGFLWHEYQVDRLARLQSIDLRYWQGTDERTPHGRKTRKVVFPTQMNGADCEVQIAYSTVQWSWARICSLGGMSPEDPRLLHKVLPGQTLADIAELYHAVEHYDELAALNQLSNADEINAGQLLQIREPDIALPNSCDVRLRRCGPVLSEQDQLAGDYSRVSVLDPLGCVAQLNNGLTMLLLNQQEMLDDLQGGFLANEPMETPEKCPYPYLLSGQTKWYEQPSPPINLPQGERWTQEQWQKVSQIAQLSQAMFADETAQAAMTDEQKTAFADAYDRLDQEALKQWLRVDERAAIRAEYRELQTILIEYLTGRRDVYEQLSYSIDVFDVLEDYAWLTGVRYCKLWDCFADMVNHMAINPSRFDEQYDTQTVVESETNAITTAGAEFIAAVYEGDHRISEWLFPSEAQVDVYSEEAPEFAPTTEVTNPAFRPYDFALAIQQQRHTPTEEGPDGEIKEAFDTLSKTLKVVDALANLYQKPEQLTKSLKLIMRLSKASQLDDLKHLKYVAAGERIDGMVMLGEYRVERILKAEIEKLNRTQRRLLAQQAFAQHAPDFDSNRPVVRMLDTQGNSIGSNYIDFIKPYQGFSEAVAEPDSWMDMFRHFGKTANGDALVTARIDMVVVPELSRHMKAYYAASQMSASELKNTGVKGISMGLFFWESFQLKFVYQQLIGAHESELWKQRGKFMVQAGATIAAFIEIVDVFMGNHKLIDYLAHSRFRAARFVSQTVPLPGTRLQVPLIRWVGPVASAFSAGFCFHESLQLFRKNDNDAAVLMLAVSALGVAGAATGLVAGAVLAKGVAVSVWIPIAGWLICIASIALLFAIDEWFRDTELETWATNSPFGKNKNDRLDLEAMNTLEKAHASLANIIWRPNAEVEVDQQNDHSNVVVTIHHPQFILGESTLEWQVEHIDQAKANTGYGLNTGFNNVVRSLQVVQPSTIQSIVESGLVTQTKLYFVCEHVGNEVFLSKNRALQTVEVTIERKRQWTLRFRHLMANGFNLPINASIADECNRDDKGWRISTWDTP